jgi:hypothetical protein
VRPLRQARPVSVLLRRSSAPGPVPPALSRHLMVSALMAGCCRQGDEMFAARQRLSSWPLAGLQSPRSGVRPGGPAAGGEGRRHRPRVPWARHKMGTREPRSCHRCCQWMGQVESSISSSKSQPCFLRLDRYLPRVLQLSHAPLPQSILFWQLEQLKWWPCADCPVPQEIFHPTTVRWPGSEPSGPEHTAGQSVGNAGDANWVLNT